MSPLDVMPIRLGDTRARVHATYGTDFEVRAGGDNYKKMGLRFEYDEDARVRSMTVGWFGEGTYHGTVYGLKAVSMLSAWREAWGPEIARTHWRDMGSQQYTFVHDGLRFRVEAWERDGRTLETGMYVRGSVRSIEVDGRYHDVPAPTTLFGELDRGMTVKRVKALVPGAITPAKPETQGKLKELLRAPEVRFLGETFVGQFYFKGGRLQRVTLSREEPYEGFGHHTAVERLRERAVPRYGPEHLTSADGDAFWRFGPFAMRIVGTQRGDTTSILVNCWVVE